MEKCSMCSKQFPEATMKKMVQIIDRKAYAQNICPACQHLAVNNPNYYYAATNFSPNDISHSEEWARVIEEAHRYQVPPQILHELIKTFGKTKEKMKKG
ncbi:hypothetical protein [Syntrophomonas palmitatica]|uniref:hypothetical protein n=1 Tax=Syntrophomonas palmitatica TaxID=402877 RepID=UPI0006D14C4E|nr:hypothetical protein [Syntrophomonas palmitatica]